MLLTRMISNGCVKKIFGVRANIIMLEKLCQRLGGYVMELRTQKQVADALEAYGKVDCGPVLLHHCVGQLCVACKVIEIQSRYVQHSIFDKLHHFTS